MGKKKQSKVGGDFWDEDPDLQAQVVVEPGSAAAAAATEEVGGLVATLKRSKKKKDEKAKLAEQQEHEAMGAQTKGKKEKDPEVREREKAKKLAAMKQRKEVQATLVGDGADTSEQPEAAEAGPKTKKKKKKKKDMASTLAALQKHLASKKTEKEEQAAAAESAKAAAAERQAARAATHRAHLQTLEQQAELEKKTAALELSEREELMMEEQVRRREAVHVAHPRQRSAKVDKSKFKAKAEEDEEPVLDTTKALQIAAEAVERLQNSSFGKKKEEDVEEEEEEEALIDDWEALAEEEDEAPEAGSKPVETKKLTANGSSSENHTEKDDLLERAAVSEARRKELSSKREARHKKALAGANAADLRSPICAILGHVDTGKTKLLDNMRKTNVQEGEAGGITQQIGATYFPIEMIEKKTEVMKKHQNVQYNVPGLLIIDTPGHESFSNLRSRGSSLCNIAILVVDIMHGLEAQTLESIRLLRDRKTPFVVALNKIDRLYGWKSTPNNSFRDSLEKQSAHVQREFEDRLEKTKLLFAEQGFNSEVYYKNKNLGRYVSLVPTSAVTGEGVPDLLYLLLELTQSRMSKQLMYLSQLEATILEVKVVEGLGTTIDVVLSNGILHEGDKIVLCGQNGPIVTTVRALLTPQPARELRIKSAYVHHKEVKAALGVKIAANDLELAVAGSRLLVVGPDDNEEELKDDVMEDVASLLDSVDKGGKGVCVQASTLGSLEALLDFLKDMKIPVMSIGLGPVYKRNVMHACTMLAKNKELAVMLCFDVKIDKDAEQYAKEQDIKIFSADIIYHLFDEFTKYQKELLEQRRRDTIHEVVYPAVMRTIQIINKRNPMIIGVDIVEGSVRIGTPIAVVKKEPLTGQKLIYNLGRVQSLQVDHKPRDEVRKGQANAGVAMRLDSGGMTNMPTWGRHIDEKDTLYSLITRRSIDVLKDPAFRDGVPREDWLLIKKLKPIFDIQ